MDAAKVQTARLREKLRGIRLLESTPSVMPTNDPGIKPDRKLARVGVFHQAL
jgi:hypothetical protein